MEARLHETSQMSYGCNTLGSQNFQNILDSMFYGEMSDNCSVDYNIQWIIQKLSSHSQLKLISP